MKTKQSSGVSVVNRRNFLIGGGSLIGTLAITEQAAKAFYRPSVQEPVKSVSVEQKEPVSVVKPHATTKPHHRAIRFPRFVRHDAAPVKLSKWDKAVLIKTIWGETRGETSRGRMAVVHVILNRRYKTNPFFKNKTISQLCLKKYQFSCWLDSWKMNHIKIDDTFKDVKEDVTKAIALYERGIDYSNGALFYWSDIMPKPPKWAKDYNMVNKIGVHNFMA